MKDEFRDCCVLIIEHMGLGEPDPGYLDDLEALNDACCAWHIERAPRMGFLKLVLPTMGGDLMTGDLSLAESAGFCGNAAAVDFVRFIDCRTKHRCTLLMLQVLAALQDALKHGSGTTVNASGGTT